jgi:hypothetical protein
MRPAFPIFRGNMRHRKHAAYDKATLPEPGYFVVMCHWWHRVHNGTLAHPRFIRSR